MHQLMIVDDEENILSALRRIFRKQSDWEIETYTDVHEALRRAQVTNFDLFLSDYRMPEMNGVEFLREIRNLQPNSIRFLLSGHADLEGLFSAINEAEIYRFVTKPWQDYELIATLHEALKYHDILAENRYLANQVREQQQQLDKHKSAIESLNSKHPDLFKVDWAEDGSISLDDSD